MTSNTQDSAVLKKDQQVITIGAFIWKIDDNTYKVFRPRRSSKKVFLPNVLELPGGHVDFGENLVTGLKREIKEEMQADIEVGDPFYAFTYINDIKQSHSLELIYFAKFKDESQIKLHPDEHSEYIWMSKEETMALPQEEKDEEYEAILRGFEILEGKEINSLK